jgi:pimeloyl-ACP methyl ester carboxylesterase
LVVGIATLSIIIERMTTKLPHLLQAKVAVVEHAGHFTPLEEPDEVGAFLREWIRAPLKAVAG